MIQVGTILKVCDKTGVTLARCIKVFGQSKKRIAYLGDIVLVSVQQINPRKFHKMKLFKKKRFFKGTLHRGLVIRTKVNFERARGIFIKFNESSVILVNRRGIPISNRIYGVVLIELCRRMPSLGCVVRYMI